MKIVKLSLGELQTNCYIVINGQKDAAIIDPGSEILKIIAVIEEEGCTPKVILLTHGHYDHIGACLELMGKYGIKVYIHPDDQELLTNGEKNLSYIIKDARFVPFTTDKRLIDGKMVILGDLRFAVLHTPGHTKGSVCLILNDMYMFTGDTLFCGTRGRTDFYGSDDLDMQESLRKIKACDKDYLLYPGHGANTTLFYEKETNMFIR